MRPIRILWTGFIRKDDNSLTMIVGNTPGTALPSTGGPVTTALYLIGIMLTVLAGACLVMYKRRRAV